jgi:steroid delta-isomerase-like uncharacterized protein
MQSFVSEKGGTKMATDFERMMNDYWAATNSHDMERILSFFTDDVVYEDVALGKVNRGKKEVKDFLSEAFFKFPDFKIEMKSGFNAGDWSVGEWIMSGTFVQSSNPGRPATSRTFSVRGVSITEFRRGKISRNSDYWDYTSFLQQVGLMPPPPK